MRICNDVDYMSFMPIPLPWHSLNTTVVVSLPPGHRFGITLFFSLFSRPALDPELCSNLLFRTSLPHILSNDPCSTPCLSPIPIRSLPGSATSITAKDQHWQRPSSRHRGITPEKIVGWVESHGQGPGPEDFPVRDLDLFPRRTGLANAGLESPRSLDANYLF